MLLSRAETPLKHGKHRFSSNLPPFLSISIFWLLRAFIFQLPYHSLLIWNASPLFADFLGIQSVASSSECSLLPSLSRRLFPFPAWPRVCPPIPPPLSLLFFFACKRSAFYEMMRHGQYIMARKQYALLYCLFACLPHVEPRICHGMRLQSRPCCYVGTVLKLVMFSHDFIALKKPFPCHQPRYGPALPFKECVWRGDPEIWLNVRLFHWAGFFERSPMGTSSVFRP